MTKTFLITAGISGLIAVIMDAIGTYYLLGNLTPEHMVAFSTAIQMQMYHTLAILAITFFNRYVSRAIINATYYFFLFGILFFSFPVYINSTTEVTGINMGAFSFIAGIGSLLFLIGWINIIWSGIKYVHHKRSRKKNG